MKYIYIYIYIYMRRERERKRKREREREVCKMLFGEYVAHCYTVLWSAYHKVDYL